MKILVCLCLYLIFKGPLLLAAETGVFDIITVSPYEVSAASLLPSLKTVGSEIKSKGATVGDALGVIDIVEEAKNRIEPFKNKMIEYFPNAAALDTFINQKLTDGRNKTIGIENSDTNILLFFSNIGHELIGGIVDKALEKKGIKDPKRRKFWIQQTLLPFSSCIGGAKNAFFDGMKCLENIAPNLPPNIGLALVYELTNTKLVPGWEKARPNILKDQVSAYKLCLSKRTLTSDQATENVQDCAMKTIKNGIVDLSEFKLSETLNKSASSDKQIKRIKGEALGKYKHCVAKIAPPREDQLEQKDQLEDQFINCIDKLMFDAGNLLVEDQIINKPELKETFSPTEIFSISLESKNDFKDCLENLKAKNIREDGLLKNEICKNLVTNNVTYKAILKKFAVTSADSFKDDSILIQSQATEGKRLLDKCWDKNQTEVKRNQCLRKTIIAFAQSTANIKLNQSIPDELCSKNTLLKDSLNQLTTCLENQLTASPSEDKKLENKINKCKNQLTLKMAKIVSEESLKNKAAEIKMNPTQTDKLIQELVSSQFVSCLGTVPSEEIVNRCGSELKRKASLSLASFIFNEKAQGKIPPEDIEKLNTSLIKENFSQCLGSTPDDSKITECSNTLTKEATKAITLASGKIQLKKVLNASIVPSVLIPVEESFIACIDKTSFPVPEKKICIKEETPIQETPSPTDECVKQFAFDFAKSLGELKLLDLMKTILGNTDYLDQKPKFEDMISKYNTCLDEAKPYSLEGGFLNKMTECTNSLQNKGILYVSSTISSLMSNGEKDAATIMIKEDFSLLITCISDLLPPSPFSEKQKENAESLLRPVAQFLANYIDYSPGDAKRTIEDIIKILAKDLSETIKDEKGKEEAKAKLKAELLDMLYQRGALDQFLKSMIQEEMKIGLKDIPEEELSEETRKYLLSKAPYESLFKSEEGKMIKDMAMEKILKPVLIGKLSMSSPLIDEAKKEVKARTTEILVNSSIVGGKIIKMGVQDKINKKLNIITKTLIKVAGKEKSVNWENVRSTPKGQAAEKFIRENIVMPKFKKLAISPEELKKAEDEAQRLVKEAIKSYGK